MQWSKTAVAFTILGLAATASADPGEGLPIRTAPEVPERLNGDEAEADADLSGRWEGELRGERVVATFTRDADEPGRYRIRFQLPGGATLELSARFDGRSLLTRLLEAAADAGAPDEDADEDAEIAEILDELRGADGVGLSGALEELKDRGTPQVEGSQPAVSPGSPAAGGGAPRGGAGSLPASSPGNRPAPGNYQLSGEGDNQVLRRRGGANGGANDPAPVPTLRRAAQADTIHTMALALGIWTEARDNGNADVRRQEMIRVGGVILNRANTNYRRQNTVRGTVLDRYQFSHFNSRSNPERVALESGNVATVTQRMQGRARWDEALAIARGLENGTIANPWTDNTVRHYYSPRSMVPRNSTPAWVIASREVRVPGISRNRFRWYRGIR